MSTERQQATSTESRLAPSDDTLQSRWNDRRMLKLVELLGLPDRRDKEVRHGASRRVMAILRRMGNNQVHHPAPSWSAGPATMRR